MQLLGIAIGVILILNSIAVSIFTSVNLGNLLPAFIGILIIAYILFYNKIKNYAPRFLHNGIKICLIIFSLSFAISTVVIYKNSVQVPPKGTDAVIVLGAGLKGSNVSLTLAHRLDAAMEYHAQNPESIIIVSGGQGPNEEIPEALAMKNYLVSNGVDEDFIIQEDKSSRTVENFRLSKEILEEKFNGEPYSVVYVTNGFHVFRAGLIAEQEGLTAYGLSSESVSYLEPTNYIREYFSLIKYFVLDR